MIEIEKKIICFMGPEGSGKSSVGRKLALETGKPFVTTGEIFRNLAENDDGELGEECRKMLSANVYLTPATFLKILSHRFAQKDVENGMVLDGGMRTVEETEYFQPMLEEAGVNLPVQVIYLQIPYWESYKRLVFGKEARKREDDTWIGVYKRLSKFYSKLEKRIKIIEQQPNWSLSPIDANRSREEVYEEVRRACLG